jgi:hypothetical protein
MQSKMMRCIRCEGRKKMYMMNGGYTHVNMGALQVDCPLCLGKGQIPFLENAIEEVKKETLKIKDKKERKSKDAKEISDNTDKT